MLYCHKETGEEATQEPNANVGDPLIPTGKLCPERGIATKVQFVVNKDESDAVI